MARLKSLKCWLNWREERDTKGDLRKVPYYADGARRVGTLDSPPDKRRLVTYGAASAAATKSGRQMALALGPHADGQFIQGVDLDHSDQHPELADVVKRLPGYVEVSPSGNGYHALGIGKDFPTLATNASGIEAYSCKRFFTFTGKALRDGAPTDLLPFVLQELAPRHTTRKPSKKAPIAASDSKYGHVLDGQRNTTLWTLAVRLWHMGLRSPEALRNALSAFNAENFDPPLEERVIADQARRICAGERPASDLSDWIEPQLPKVELSNAMAADVESLLPKAVAVFVHDEAERMSCSPDYVAASWLVSAGALLSPRIGIRPKQHDDWIVTPNLYGGIVGEPASRKSAAIDSVKRFVDRQEARQEELHQAKQREYLAAAELKEAQHKALRGRLREATRDASDTDATEAVKALTDLRDPKEPHKIRFVSNDPTVEKAGDILAHNEGRGLLDLRDELAGLFMNWQREGRESDRTFYLQAWNGASGYSIDRIGRGSLHIPTLSLSVFGGTQPEVWARVVTDANRARGNDGMFARFQVMVYPEEQRQPLVDRRPLEGAREAMRDLFDHLADLDPATVGAHPANDFVKVPYLHFDTEAQAVFYEWLNELQQERIPSAANDPLLQQHLGKYDKLFCATALILHLAEYRRGPIRVDTAERAAAWCEYLESHARRIYALVEAAPVRTAAMVARRLADGKLPDGFTAKNLVDKGWTGIHSAAEAMPVLSVLTDKGWLRPYERTTADGGRPTTYYAINPHVLKEVK